ncbi:MAG: HD domain-containing phosphohydrolase [Candidatus Brocadiales bacterium]|nr:HD domain-containing phosphohydrolase [Candidatus Brocadiales bacterium]
MTTEGREARMEKAKAFSKMLEELAAHPSLSIAEAMCNETSIINTNARTSEKPGKAPTSLHVVEELRQEEKEVLELYCNATEFAKETLCNIEGGKSVEAGTVELEISKLANKLILRSKELLTLATEAKEPSNGDYLASSMTNVSIIAMTVATVLGYNKPRLVQLGNCAFFANIGMIKLMPIVRHERLNAEAYKEIKKHPLYGAETLERLGLPKDYIQTALQHHEREDGSGYPSGLRGDMIHEFAKIVGLAEIVESLSHERPFRPALPIHSVVKEVVENWRGSIHPKIIKALVKVLGVYPVGTMVELSSGEIARIIKNDPVFPLRPWVQVFAKEDDENNQSKIINLSGKTNLYIKKPVGAIDRGEKGVDFVDIIV